MRHHRHKHDDETDDRDIELPHEQYGHVKNRSLPLSTVIEILKQKTGKNDIDVGKLRLSLYDIFGEDASPKVKKFMKVILNKLQHGDGGSDMETEVDLPKSFSSKSVMLMIMDKQNLPWKQR